MALTFAVYTFLLLIAIGLSKISLYYCKLQKQKYSCRFLIYIFILLAACIIGMRYDVGVDYMSYLEYYETNGWGQKQMEPLFALIVNCTNFFNFHYSVVFFIFHCLIFYFLVKSADVNKELLPFILFFAFTGDFFFSSMNIIRHAIAFSIFAYAIKYIEQGKFLSYLIYIICASLFHVSALILIPFYFILNRGWLTNRSLILGILVGVSLLNLQGNIFEIILVKSLTLIGYSSYAENIQFVINEFIETKTGLGVLIYGIVDFINIYFSNSLRQRYPVYKIYFNLYLLGLIIYLVFPPILTVGRMNFYFITFRLFISAYTTYFLINNRNMIYKGIGGVMISIYLALFVAGILGSASQCSPFQFFFQNKF